MPKKKAEDEITPASENTEATVDETAVEAAATDTSETEAPKRARRPKPAEQDASPAAEGSIIDTVVEAAAGALETVAVTIGKTAADVVSAVAGPAATPAAKVHKRAERIGIVSSDKMTKTVVVRVDRLVKHPVYRKYVRKRKKFMAHDETGAKIGDKVRIIETRPLSARKRWRVVEIIQKAAV
jgi:small subunit ribosomal protein S17